MGRISGIQSRRRRNNKQKRRLRLGLIAGSVLGLSALLLFGVWAIRAGGPSGSGLNVSSADILVESERSMEEYMGAGDVHTVTANVAAQKCKDDTTVISDVIPGTVTPSSAAVTEGGTVILKAVPRAGFSFLHWKKGNEPVSANSILTVSNVTGDVTYTAVFYYSAVRVIYKNVILDPTGKKEIGEGGGYITDSGNNIQLTEEYISYSSNTGLATIPIRVADPSSSYGQGQLTDHGNAYWRVEKYRDDRLLGTSYGTTGQLSATSVQNSETSVVVTAFYKRSSNEVTMAVQPSGIAYIVAGDKTSPQPSAPPNGTSYVTNSSTVTGKYLFTLVMPREDKYIIRTIFDADTGTAYAREDSTTKNLVTWTNTSVDPSEPGHPSGWGADNHLYKIEVDSTLAGHNFIIKLNKENTYLMGEIVTVARPSEGGITNGDMSAEDSYNTVLSTTLSATPNEGYMFDHWEYYDEKGDLVISKKQQLPVAMSGYHIFTAVFVEDAYEVKAEADPEGSGVFSGTGMHGVHSDASVTAKPQPGYAFDKWTWNDEDGNSHESKNNPLVIKDIQADYNLTAHFSKANPVVTLTVTPLGNDTTNSIYNYAKMTDGSVSYDTPGPGGATPGVVTGSVTGGSSVTLQAFPNEHEDYQFSYWVDQDGNTNSSNPYTVGDLKDDASYIAVFTKKQDQYAIEAIHEPDAAGTANITITGTTTAFTDKGYVPPHSGVTVTATPAAGYIFEKWTWKTAEGLEHEEYNDTVTFTDIMQDYTLVAHYSKENPTIVLKANPVDKDGYGYNYATATYTKYPSGSGTATAQTSDTTGETTFTALGNESVTLQAFPNENNDYQFAYWIDKKGNTYQANPYVAGKITEDDEYTAIFTKKQDKYELIGVSDPKGGGSIGFEIDNPDGSHDSFNEKGYVVPKANAVITATPSSTDYEFDRWTWKTVDGTEQRSTDNPLILNGILQDYTLTAHFILKQPKVTVKVDPLGEKDGKYNDVLISDNSGHSASTGSGGSVSVDVSGGDAITLQALPNENNDYQFSYWVDKDGNTSPSNPYVIGKISDDEEYTAVFTKKQDKYEVKIVSDPDEAGTFTGDGKYDIHSNVTVTATANAGYTFDKWTWKALDGEEHESHDATMTINDITEDHILTAHFFKNSPKITVNVSPIGDKKGSYNYAEVSDTDGHMESTGSSGTVTLDVTGSSAVTLKAVPNKDADYKFIYWVDQDGNVNNSNPFAVGKISKDMTYTALFTSEEDHEIKVLASPPSGGKVSAKKNDSGGFNISAKANRGYKFKYWKCTDTEKTVTTETSFTVSKDEAAKGYTYIAYFEGTGEKTTSDLINEYFPNIRRLFAQPNYKYTRDYWISYVSNFVSGKKAESKPASGVPVEWNAYAAAETMMDEKAADSEEIVITAQSELITTENEIIPISTSSDTGNAEERAKEITDEKFGDHYIAEVVCVKNVSAPEGFDDGTRTYLWYNTGVQRDDNLFIIYEQDGAERIVSPVTDRHGTMTFTIDKLGATNQFALVRVLVK